MCTHALCALLQSGLPLKVFHSLSTNLSAEGGGAGGAAQAMAQAQAAGALVAAGARAVTPGAVAVRGVRGWPGVWGPGVWGNVGLGVLGHGDLGLPVGLQVAAGARAVTPGDRGVWRAGGKETSSEASYDGGLVLCSHTAPFQLLLLIN